MEKISVVIPTKNRLHVLEKCLGSLSCQTFKFPFEVILIDDGSDAATYKKEKEWQTRYPFALMVHRQESKGPAAARNLGIRKASGDLILILNDDVIAASDLLERHWNGHHQLGGGNIAILGNRQVPADLQDNITSFIAEKCEFVTSFHDFKPYQLCRYQLFITFNLSIKKDLFWKWGFFDEEFPEASGEDTELGFRMCQQGLKIFYCPEARAYHNHEYTMDSLFQLTRKSGRNTAILISKHIECMRELPFNLMNSDEIKRIEFEILDARDDVQKVKAELSKLDGLNIKELAANLNFGAGIKTENHILKMLEEPLSFIKTYYWKKGLLEGWKNIREKKQTNCNVTKSDHIQPDQYRKFNVKRTGTTNGVSVVIPTYNRAGLITRAIESVIAQTVPVQEIIVVDDGSTDDTSSLIASLTRRHPTIKYIALEKNSGAQKARNVGINLSTSEWIAFLDSDDVFIPDKLEKQLALAINQKYNIVHCECFCQGSQRDERTLFGTPPYYGDIYKKLLRRPAPTFPGLLVKKECLQKIGLLDEAIQSYQEWDTGIRLARHFYFGFIDEPLFIYHLQDSGSISNDLKKEAEGYEQIVRKHAGEITRVVGKYTLSNHYKILAQKFCALPDITKAVRYISEYGRIESLDTTIILQKKIELLFHVGKEFIKNRQYEPALDVFDHIMYTPADNIDVQKLRTICLAEIGRSKEIPRSNIEQAHLAPGVALF